MLPRIYTYKITFEEAPYWYWGVHKEKKFGELYLGSPVTHAWVWEFYTPKSQILEFFPNTEEGWKEAQSVEKRLIGRDLNNPMCLNENCGGLSSLASLSRAGKKGSAATHVEKDERGKSKHAVKMGKKAHEEKNESGRSVHGVKRAEALHEEKNKEGKSINSVRGGVNANAALTPEQRSEKGKKGAKAAHASRTPEQKIKYGRRAAEACHRQKNEEGKSINAIKCGQASNKKKDNQGRSINAVKGAIAANASMTPEQKTERSRKAATNTNKQVWESTVDGFKGNAGAVANHNKANGWDPNARVKVN
jgi:hypothetical protein